MEKNKGVIMSVVEAFFGSADRQKKKMKEVEAHKQKTQDIGKEVELVLAGIRAEADAEAIAKGIKERKAAHAAGK
jgi:hypothetical protein